MNQPINNNNTNNNEEDVTIVSTDLTIQDAINETIPDTFSEKYLNGQKTESIPKQIDLSIKTPEDVLRRAVKLLKEKVNTDPIQIKKLLSDPVRLKKIQEKECFIQAARDPLFFIRNYVKISTQAHGVIPFKMYSFQEKALIQIHENKRIIILKSRQLGISTLLASYSVWLMVFNKGKNILIISKTQNAATEVISKVKVALDELPAFLKLAKIENNLKSVKLANGSKVLAVSSASDASRGYSCSFIILDECIARDSSIYIKNKQTNEIKSVKIGELYDRKDYK